MGCSSCAKRRNRAKQALQNRNYKQAGREVVSGAKAMAGMIPKDQMPTSRNDQAVVGRRTR
jgi:hypothetical protein